VRVVVAVLVSIDAGAVAGAAGVGETKGVGDASGIETGVGLGLAVVWTRRSRSGCCC